MLAKFKRCQSMIDPPRKSKRMASMSPRANGPPRGRSARGASDCPVATNQQHSPACGSGSTEVLDDRLRALLHCGGAMYDRARVVGGHVRAIEAGLGIAHIGSIRSESVAA